MSKTGRKPYTGPIHPDKLDQFVADIVDYVEGTGQWDAYRAWMERNKDYLPEETERMHEEIRRRAGRT